MDAFHLNTLEHLSAQLFWSVYGGVCNGLFPSGKIIGHQFKTEEDWEAIEEKAKALGMHSRTQLLREIARGFIEKKSSVYSGQRSFGKILSQLKELQRSHQAYL